MASGGKSQCVRQVLRKLDAIDDRVHDKKQLLISFLDELHYEMRNSGCPLLEDSYFLFSGSSYERTTVHDGADYDIIVTLSRPFKADNFELIERHEPGIFKLRPFEEYERDLEKWLNRNGFLEVEKLKEYAFDELENLLSSMRERNWSLSCRKSVSAMTVTLKDVDDGSTLKIDLVPAMRGSEIDEIPGMCVKKQLPSPLLRKKHFEYFICLAAAPFLDNESDYHLLTSVSFSTMEKECMLNETNVANAVRLMKLTSLKNNWKKSYGLRSFHIKRVAIKYYDDIEAMGNWEAYCTLLNHLSEDLLKRGEIDGFFIGDQNIYCKDEVDGKELAREIKKEAKRIQPKTLLAFVSSEHRK